MGGIDYLTKFVKEQNFIQSKMNIFLRTTINSPAEYSKWIHVPCINVAEFQEYVRKYKLHNLNSHHTD